MPLQTWAMLRDPVKFLRRCRERHGPIFRVRLLGYPRYVYVTDPDLAREVFATDRTVGRAGEVREPFLGPLVGKHSLLSLDGEEWLRQRKLIGPAFHRRQVEGYAEEIASIADDQLKLWSTGAPVQLRPAFQQITLEVILHVVLGLDDGPRRKRLRELLPELIDAAATPWLWAVPKGGWTRLERSALARRAPHPLRSFLRTRDEVDALIFAELAERRRGTADRADVLTLLMQSTDEDGGGMTSLELRDELITLLVAGHETTATALAWTIERLVRSPTAYARLRESLDSGDDSYLEAVIKESLRSRSVVLDTPRKLNGPIALGGYDIPSGWFVAPALPLVQEAAAEFPHPERFEPERFLGDGPVSGWIPFGGGKRHCVGSHFALLELKVILRRCLERFEFEAVDPADESLDLQHVTLVPGALARVRLQPRTADRAP